MRERRENERQPTSDFQVRCLMRFPSGAVFEGDVVDYSVHGARVAGPTHGLKVGDAVSLTFVFLTNEKVRYECIVVHIAPSGDSYGVLFRSDPVPIDVLEHE